MVTGMHRSGTSFLSSILHASGIDMGERLVPAGKGNERGHFEDEDIVQFHIGIMSRQNWRLGRGSRLPVVTANDHRRAEELIHSRGDKAYWGFKDPRTSLFLDLWSTLLPQAKWVFVVRHPLQVADSLRRRDDNGGWWWKSDTMRVRSWQLHTSECLRFAARNPNQARVFLLPNLTAHAGQCAAELTSFLGHEVSEDTIRSHFDARLLTTKLPSSFVLPLDYLQAMRTFREAGQLSAVRERTGAAQLAQSVSLDRLSRAPE